VSDEDAASLSGSLLDAPAAELAPALGGYGLRRGEDLLGLIRIAPQVVELATRESAWTVEQEGGAWDFLARSHPGQEPVARFERQGAGGRFTIFATDADVALRRAGWLSSRWELEADDEGLLAGGAITMVEDPGPPRAPSPSRSSPRRASGSIGSRRAASPSARPSGAPFRPRRRSGSRRRRRPRPSAAAAFGERGRYGASACVSARSGPTGRT